MDHSNGKDHAAAEPPEWLPSAEEGTQAVPCGKWFDAVRVPQRNGPFVLARLNRASGPVIQGPVNWFWLIGPGLGDDWNLPAMAVLGIGSHIAVPPANSTAAPLPRWLLAPVGDCLTDPEPLRSALTVIGMPGVRHG
ncbi:hypothetical protein [Streptomyces sp. NBC_01803]|uniref:hypothetical protein n=1 Tax=Streptomyces sp. NBC_01803 TaxID=2975946 RepID=UPI002DD9B7E3|nr:hypothetical protein [Streptomyces sp. NBC_01803]WSA44544.1 hypothetical protein OIE51_10195 [Streptomyces sp. NBC_01803]WSA45450.1 hypothetical protein OIE51_15315 [Streptomyces sp. NBC_01803]